MSEGWLPSTPEEVRRVVEMVFLEHLLFGQPISPRLVAIWRQWQAAEGDKLIKEALDETD